jgi:tripartite-type tricarboxylate transporter receptor subunit TctC
MLGVNEVYNAAPNGLTINIQNAVASVTNQMAGVKGVRYDLLKYSWIGRVTTDRRVLAMRKGAPVKTIQELMNSKKPIKIGATGLGGSTYVDAVITKDTLNLPIEVIHGYDSSSEIDLGLLRGEIDGTYGSYSSRLKMVKGGEQFIILQSGTERSSVLAKVPTWFEVAPTDKAEQVLKVLNAMHATGRPLAAPPGVPADRLAFLQEAFDKTMKDPDFIKSAKKAKREVNYLSGKDMKNLIQTSLDIADPKIKKIFIEAIKGEI